MKTNRMFTVLRLLVLGVLVAGFNAKLASAQVLKGKFTLSSETRWGLATLPAGDYSFTLDKGTMDGHATVYRGDRPVAMIPTRAISKTTSDRSEMVLEGGMVHEVCLPLIGLTLIYPVYNHQHRAAPQEPQAARIIPVAAVGVGR
jgi:hypothetical protein